LGDACSVALDLVTRSEALRSEDVGLFVCFVVLNEGDVARPARVVLDSNDGLKPWFVAMVVDQANPPSVTTTPVTDGYLAAVIPAAGASLCNS